MNGSTKQSGRLQGRAVFLSASVPHDERDERYRRIAGAHLRVEGAVLSLTRAVFANGGRLVFGGHPAISPLVAMVAGEFFAPRRRDAVESEPVPIVVYQSEIYRDNLPLATPMMFEAGYAHIRWTPPRAGECFAPDLPKSAPPYPQSLHHMRERMIEETQPIAMVVIGGMEGIKEEAALFARLRPERPIYVFAETGGAAAILAEEGVGERGCEVVRVFDRQILENIERRRSESSATAASRSASASEAVVPYPLVAQLLVDELAEREVADGR